MKLLPSIILFIQLLLVSSSIFCQRVSFLFIEKEGGSTDDIRRLSRGFNDLFCTEVSKDMLDNLTCVVIRNLKDAKYCMAELRLQGTVAFGNQNVAPKIEKLTNSIMNSDYWVSYSLYQISEDKAKVEVKCDDHKGNSS